MFDENWEVVRGGDHPELARGLLELDELVVVTWTYDAAPCHRSYELLAQAFALNKPRAVLRNRYLLCPTGKQIVMIVMSDPTVFHIIDVCVLFPPYSYVLFALPEAPEFLRGLKGITKQECNNPDIWFDL
ncbi:MAG: hypothetical protein ACREQ7_18080 [Candidatus Binatia bacterium]